MFTICKDVPLPELPKTYQFPLDKLEVGDSFLFEFVKHGSDNTKLIRSHLFQTIVRYNKLNKTNIKVITRKESLGIRVWRVS